MGKCDLPSLLTLLSALTLWSNTLVGICLLAITLWWWDIFIVDSLSLNSAVHTYRHMLNKECQRDIILCRRHRNLLWPMLVIVLPKYDHQWCETLIYFGQSAVVWVVSLYATPLSDLHPALFLWKEMGQRMIHVCKQSHTCCRSLTTWCWAVLTCGTWVCKFFPMKMNVSQDITNLVSLFV